MSTFFAKKYQRFVKTSWHKDWLFNVIEKGQKKSICAIFLLKSQLCLTKANFVSKNDMKRIPLPNEPIP